MKISKIIIITVIASFLFIGMGQFVNEWTGQYREINETQTSSVIERVTNQTSALKTRLESTSVSADDPIEGFLVVTNSAFQGATLLTNVPVIFTALILDMTSLLPAGYIPAFVTDTIMAIVLLIVIFGVMAFFLKVKE